MDPTTVQTRTLLHGEITFDTAREEEYNVLHRLTYPEKRDKFLHYIQEHKKEIEAVVAYHLGVTDTKRCQLSLTKDWIHGSFNLCIPVYVHNWVECPGKRMIIRFPLPYKIGESNYPGNADEKLRCEAATYAWIQTNCPDVPIPRLWGFGFSNGQSFTALANTPIYIRVIENLRRLLLSLFGYPLPCRYMPCRSPHALKTGYLLMDCIEKEDGIMLSESWENLRHDKALRANLFKDLSRIILSLTRIPLPRIGSFTINDKGVLNLTNRPLTLPIHQLENEDIPTKMNRNTTYTAIEPYLHNLLACHDSRLLHQPNSTNDESDCRAQMAAITGMRSVLHQFIGHDNLYRGSFFFTLTDIHQSNIFVDENWRIKYMIDLEWACSLPAEMQKFPHWITSQDIDRLLGKNLTAFNGVREEFMEVFENEERVLLTSSEDLPLRTLMLKDIWDTKKFWFFHALDDPGALAALFWQHIQPMFARSHISNPAFEQIFSKYWAVGADEFAAAKVEDRQNYERQLRDAFESNMEIGSKE